MVRPARHVLPILLMAALLCGLWSPAAQAWSIWPFADSKAEQPKPKPPRVKPAKKAPPSAWDNFTTGTKTFLQHGWGEGGAEEEAGPEAGGCRPPADVRAEGPAEVVVRLAIPAEGGAAAQGRGAFHWAKTSWASNILSLRRKATCHLFSAGCRREHCTQHRLERVYQGHVVGGRDAAGRLRRALATVRPDPPLRAQRRRGSHPEAGGGRSVSRCETSRAVKASLA